MRDDSPLWHQITPSGYAWEREALDRVRAGLPDTETYRAWANFEFIADNGAVYEVDLAVLTPAGLFLVEIKSRPGTLRGDGHTWTWRTPEGRTRTDDNPLVLANRKAKYLKSRLERTKAARGERLPFFQAVVFCSAPGLDVRLDEVGRMHVFGRDRVQSGPPSELTRTTALPGILAMLRSVPATGRRVELPMSRLVERAMSEAGVRRSNRSRHVGDYELDRLLTDGPGFQDFVAHHLRAPGVVKRVRIYRLERAGSARDRALFVRASEREYQVLQGVHHEGILQVEGFTEHEQGPALIFEHDATSQRLDHWMAEHGAKLDFEGRLGIIRRLAEAMRYAHSRGLHHRALSPQSILVSGAPDRPMVKVFSWPTARRGFATSLAAAGAQPAPSPSASGPSAPSPQPIGTFLDTYHLHGLVDRAADAYLAPEAHTNPDADPVALDVFGVGAIAFFVLSGRAPASSGIELTQILRAGDGLQLSSVVDGVDEDLRTLVQLSTAPNVAGRIDSMATLLGWLDKPEKTAASTETKDSGDEPVADPDQAVAGDRLEGGWTLALLVDAPGDTRRVLKIARNAEADARVEAEAEVLDELTHAAIVRSYGTTSLSGRSAIILAPAGDRTLAEHLRREPRPALDLLQRWGDDLLAALAHLELTGIAHRDIKPDNLGIAEVGVNDERHLVLFDFSLARAPADAIRAGTPPYLEPFLSLRQPPRWDTAAERFAAAVTLHQLATGRTPVWGDGLSDPAVLDVEATIAAEAFEPTVRLPLTAFFTKALRRDPKVRFDTSDEMRRAWQRVFEAAATPVVTTAGDEPVPIDALVAAAERITPLAALGLTPRALDVLERINVLTADDLLATSATAVNSLRGTSNTTRREIAGLRQSLTTRWPCPPADPPITDGAEPDPRAIDQLVPQLVPRTAKGGVTGFQLTLWLLGLAEERDGRRPSRWPTVVETAEAVGISRQRGDQLAHKARDRWSRLTAVTRLRGDVAALLASGGSVMEIGELAAALIATRGSAAAEPQRSAGALAALRAATETELSTATPRWVQRRHSTVVLLALDPSAMDRPATDRSAPDRSAMDRSAMDRSAMDRPATDRSAPDRTADKPPIDAFSIGGPFIDGPSIDGPSIDRAGDATADERLTWALRLGKVADRLAVIEPLPAPATVLVELRAVVPPAGMAPLAEPRLVALAAAASNGAAATARLELYPRGLDTLRALRLAQSTLVGAGGLGADDVAQRVKARYPQAAPLPGRPALDRLLTDAGIELVWEAGAGDGSGAYVPKAARLAGLGSSTSRISHHTTVGVHLVGDDDATRLEHRLEAAAHAGGFLALTVEPRLYERAATQLERFGIHRVSVEELLLRHLHAKAEEVRAAWDVVVAADAAGPGSRDWSRLLTLVRAVIPAVESDLRDAGDRIVVSELGPLARYGAMHVLERLRDDAGRPGAPALVFVLVAADATKDLPVVDGRALPVLTDNQWARLPERWVTNAHRTEPAPIGAPA